MKSSLLIIFLLLLSTNQNISIISKSSHTQCRNCKCNFFLTYPLINFAKTDKKKTLFYENKINQLIKNDFEKNTVKACNNLKSIDNYNESTTFEMKFFNGKVMSFKYFTTIKINNKNILLSDSYNLDLTEIKKIKLEELVENPDLFKKLIKKLIITKGLSSVKLKDNFSFYITQKDLVIFNLFEEKTYKDTEIKIDFNLISDILKYNMKKKLSEGNLK